MNRQFFTNLEGITLKQYRLVLPIIFLGMLAVIVGCGGGDQDEQVQAEKPQSLVPVNLDTLIAETGSTYDGGQPAGGGSPGELTEPIGDPSGDFTAEAAQSAPAAEMKTTPTASVVSGTVGSGRFSLQLGSFRRENNAVELAFKIKELGHPATVEVADVGGLTYHRVFVRGLADRNEAENLGEELRSGLGINYLVLRSQ